MFIYRGLQEYKGFYIEYWSECYIVKHKGEELVFKRKRDALEWIDKTSKESEG